MLIPILLLLFGLVILTVGADSMVEGASSIARRMGISPLIIGLTIVGFGTSAPEFVVSFFSAVLKDAPDIALGNVVGSNIANIGLILGVSALILPLTTDRGLLRRDVPTMFALFAVATAAAILTGVIDRAAGAVLFAGLVGYLALCLRQANAQRRDAQASTAARIAAAEAAGEQDVAPESGSATKDVFRLLLGFTGLVIGAQLMVDNAVTIARSYGISELVIGVTIVAIGTSLPELATSAAAALKKETDISVGNIIGSNIFNTGFILGGVALFGPIPVAAQAQAFDIPYMGLTALLVLPMLLLGRINRAGGALLLVSYALYLYLTWAISVGQVVLPTAWTSLF